MPMAKEGVDYPRHSPLFLEKAHLSHLNTLVYITCWLFTPPDSDSAVLLATYKSFVYTLGTFFSV